MNKKNYCYLGLLNFRFNIFFLLYGYSLKMDCIKNPNNKLIKNS